MRNSKNGLEDLKRLHQASQKARVAAEQAKRQTLHPAPVPERPVEDGRVTFKRFTQSVTPIKQTGRRAPSPSDALHAHREADRNGLSLTSTAIAMRRAAAVGEGNHRADAGFSDGTEITHLLSEGGTAFVRSDVAPDTARNLRRGQWRAGAELDLHGLRVEQARHAAISFLDECLEHGIRCVRIVHGKGYGSQGLEPVLKDKVRTWLVQKADVMAFSEAPEREGGSGALLVLLRQISAEHAEQHLR
jgi:DNA-nicking Smr family endonuclease